MESPRAIYKLNCVHFIYANISQSRIETQNKISLFHSSFRRFDILCRACADKATHSRHTRTRNIKYVLKRVSFESKDCTKELKLECAYFESETPSVLLMIYVFVKRFRIRKCVIHFTGRIGPDITVSVLSAIKLFKNRKFGVYKNYKYSPNGFVTRAIQI